MGGRRVGSRRPIAVNVPHPDPSTARPGALDDPPRSGPAIALLVAATVLASLAALGGIAMLFTFAGICSPTDDCGSWRRRQAPIVVAIGFLGAMAALVVGMVTVAGRRAAGAQVASGLVAVLCAGTALAFEVVYFTR